MKLVINGTTHVGPTSPVSIGGEHDVTVEWQPTSSAVGIGYSPLGSEVGGFGGTFPPNLKYTYVRVVDTASGAVVFTSEAVWPNDCRWTYPAAQNKLDNGGAYRSGLTFYVVQVSPQGTESSSPPSVQTTA